MELRFEPVTERNRREVEALHTGAGQEGFVESVAECLKEADGLKCWRPVAILDGEKLVGFAMYGFFFLEYLPFGRLWLDRLLIGERWQGMGYGRKAMEGLLKKLDGEYGGRKVYLSVVERNPVAVKLYESFGFVFTGERDIHGEHVMVLRRQQPPKQRRWQSRRVQ